MDGLRGPAASPACQSAVPLCGGACNCPGAGWWSAVACGLCGAAGEGVDEVEGVRGRGSGKPERGARQLGKRQAPRSPQPVCNDELALLLVDIKKSTTGDAPDVARRTCPSRPRGVPCSLALVLHTPYSVLDRNQDAIQPISQLSPVPATRRRTTTSKPTATPALPCMLCPMGSMEVVDEPDSLGVWAETGPPLSSVQLSNPSWSLGLLPSPSWAGADAARP